MSEALLNQKVAIKKEKSADEIFEKLGYTLDEEDEDYIGYEANDGYWSSADIHIVFSKKTKEYSKYLDYDEEEIYLDINIDEHKAIHKKMQELGWL